MKLNILKHIIKQLKQNYRCSECQHDTISDEDISIVGAAGVSANIDIKCPKCQKHLMTQINIMDNIQLPGTKKDLIEGLEKLRATLEQKNKRNTEIKRENITIKDSQIVDLSKKLRSQKNLSISDLFDNK